MAHPVASLATQYAPPWADAMWAHWPVSEDGVGLDTTGTMSIVKRDLSDDNILNGYHSFSTNPASAHVSMTSSYAESDAIWWMAGHGMAGDITTYSTANGGSWLHVNSSGGSCNGHSGNDECLSEHTSAQMHDIRLMVFQGCQTGLANGSGWSLPEYARQQLGVDASVGFRYDIGFSSNTSDTWAHYFIQYGILGWDVIDAAAAAAEAVKSVQGSYSGYNSPIVYGGGTVIYPAAYGS